MALFIRDPEVDALAEEVRRLTKAKTKTEAVRAALQAQLDREKLVQARRALPLGERLERVIARADALGPNDPNVDLKTYMDEMWGN